MQCWCHVLCLNGLRILIDSFLFQVVRQSDNDSCLLIGAGITLHECLKAHDTLKAEGINVRVFDPFCIKPFDKDGVIANAKACGGKVVTVEDHYPEGKAISVFLFPNIK